MASNNNIKFLKALLTGTKEEKLKWHVLEKNIIQK